MEFIVDYNKKSNDLEPNLESNLESNLEYNLSNNDEGLSNPEAKQEIYNDDEIDEIEINTKRTKRKASKKQMEALKKSREKAKLKIQENKRIREQYIQEKQKEEQGDLSHIKQKYEYYQRKLMEKKKELEHVNDLHTTPETITHKMTDLDFMIDRMFK